MDKTVWKKVCGVIGKPELLLDSAAQYVEELRKKSETIQEDRERLQGELDAVALERQWVITHARKGKITEDDMDYQLSALTLQELSLKRELAALGNTIRLASLDNWETQAREYISGLKRGLKLLNADPKTDEERREQFKIKRQIVKTLVEKVLIGKDRQIRVVFRLDVTYLLEQATNPDEVQQAEAYTRSFDLTKTPCIFIEL